MKFKEKLLIFSLILLWSVGIFIEVLIQYFNWLALIYPSMKLMYSHVCHQQTDKVISLGGYHLLVCSRCSGIYIGSLLSSAFLLFIPKIEISSIKYLFLSILPMIIDVVLYSIGFYTYSIEIAFFTGILFGIVGIAYIYNGLRFILIKKRKE